MLGRKCFSAILLKPTVATGGRAKSMRACHDTLFVGIAVPLYKSKAMYPILQIWK